MIDFNRLIHINFCYFRFSFKTNILNLKKVSQTEILFLSFLISLLHNSPRLLEYVGFVHYTTDSKLAPHTFLGMLFRMSFLFVFSWVVLQYNTNVVNYLKKFGKTFYYTMSIVFNGSILYLSTTFYYSLYDNFTGHELYVRDQKLLLFILIVLILGLIILSKNLRYKLQRDLDLEERERLVQQNLQNELSALKNQINPHFLFNSLNSLNSLIRENTQATNFVNKLSYMYRYILQSGQHDLISLKDELKFIESYVFLIQTRYRDKFSIDLKINKTALDYEIPVLALQLLVENAVKHNEISSKNPLHVNVYIKDNLLVVENKIQPRSTFVDSTGQGLANINKRYQLLKNKSIQISNENNIFKVKMPLI